ncbi:MAG: HDOD domain-containing protein [Desulfosarcina sp.]|nr:HDOD domain-containing protein [Desulfosarcina sp.]MBC2741910.1 HDOD domain-containing protein [Desulfosarcina sp.]MBC2764823.1 HDOD domain-containing protein [Desulfosarcina sp.]
MKAQKPFFDQISTLKNLPTLPHILLKLFEACNRDSVNLDEIAALVSKDPSLSAKILKLVNSAYFGLPQKVQEINHAVVLVGTSGIKNMAICACVYEAFPKPKKNGLFNLKEFWWHSLSCAFLSKNIAAKMKSCQSDEAFVSGLLHDIGKVVLWVNFNAAYEDILENCRNDGQRLIEGEARLGATHCEVAAWLLNRWNFQTMISDSVRYHHESPVRIAQALPMTQIVYIANFLCQNAEAKINEGVVLAQKILGFSSEECDAFIEKSGQEAKDVADALDIDINIDELSSKPIDEKDQKIQDALVRDVRNISLLMGTLEGFLTAKDQNDILSVISNGLKILLDINRLLYFLVDAEKGVLFGYFQDKEGRYLKKHSLAVSMSLDQSLLVKTILEKEPLDSFNAGAQGPLTILDEQIIRVIGGQGIYCLPLTANGDSVGVLVLAIDKSDLPQLLENAKLLNILIHKGALALRLEHMKRSQLQDIQAKRIDASVDLARRVVHEVNNPLSIIKNYLKILEIKLSGKHVAQDEIRIINEEINRVANLLKKLTDFSTQKPATQEMTDINALLMDIVKLTKDSLLRHSDVKLRIDLEQDLPKVAAEKAGLKQVFINLIKNSAEAMESGGDLYIQTRHLPPPIGGKRVNGKKDVSGYVEIQFMDDGPGIPEVIKEKLFDPYVSSKAGGHSGLGLSIAYNIIKSFHGYITCDSIPDKGTVFKIELPIQGGF